jgi:hypothetical protein
MRKIKLLLFLILLTSCAHNKPVVETVNFRSPRIERELKYYVACNPLHKTNHFYIFPTQLDHGQLVEAQAYWWEEQTLLTYSELVPDGTHDIEAWQGADLKLERDAVETEDEINGSSYIVTRDWWVGCMEKCISQGRPYQISLAEAQELFPHETPWK